MYGWMYGCMYVWMYGCMDVWMYGCIDVWMYGCMDVLMYGCMECMDVWMYVCMYVGMYVCLLIYIYNICIYIHIPSSKSRLPLPFSWGKTCFFPPPKRDPRAANGSTALSLYFGSKRSKRVSTG